MNLICVVTMCHGSAGHKPRGEKPQRRAPAWSGPVLESRPQNQDPTGAPGQISICQHVHSAFCNTGQIFQTGTTRLPPVRIDSEVREGLVKKKEPMYCF